MNLTHLSQKIETCNQCPRLRFYCREIGKIKRKAYVNDTYWSKPVPGFGDPLAALIIVGLAPAAHGANRTGRMFTGDRSGDFLYSALYRTGFANQPGSTSQDDGLQLRNVYITAAGRCAPPDNKPLPAELKNCRPFLRTELEILTKLKAVLCLGQIALRAVLNISREAGTKIVLNQFPFRHGNRYEIPVSSNSRNQRVLPVFCSYHVSQQNTFTGKLTPSMFDNLLQSIQKEL